MASDDARRLWREHIAEWTRVQTLREAIEDAHAVAGSVSTVRGRSRLVYAPDPVLPELPTFPDVLRGLACGARTRAGPPCKRTDLGRSGRCKFHGGWSTGPRTKTGKARARQNLGLRWRCELVGTS